MSDPFDLATQCDDCTLARLLAHQISTDPAIVNSIARQFVENMTTRVDGTPIVVQLSEEFAALLADKTRLELCCVNSGQENRKDIRLLLFGTSKPNLAVVNQLFNSNVFVAAACHRLLKQGQFGDDSGAAFFSSAQVVEDKTTEVAKKFVLDDVFSAALLRTTFMSMIFSIYAAMSQKSAEEESGSHVLSVTREILLEVVEKTIAKLRQRCEERLYLQNIKRLFETNEAFLANNFLGEFVSCVNKKNGELRKTNCA